MINKSTRVRSAGQGALLIKVFKISKYLQRHSIIFLARSGMRHPSEIHLNDTLFVSSGSRVLWHGGKSYLANQVAHALDILRFERLEKTDEPGTEKV